ncbi:MAG: thioredoxin family protein [Candidatus Bathyarchaeota archaeon]|nr:thioredoxin family protein [Candidatus Bathyarchaeota archaeon]MDH5790630.1 thioredoxin family protein [Candidatus Bathyarchaeota archaeon]
MTEKLAYFDMRSDFWRRNWEMASDYDSWIGGSAPGMARRWIESGARTPALTDDQLARLRGYDRRMNVLMYAGIWCGDCARTGPMLRKIAEACGDGVLLRVIDRDASGELRDELRLVGATRVPVVVFLSEDWWEVGRFGDRTLSVYRAKAAREVGRGQPAGVLAPVALEAEMGEWVDVFERMLLMIRLSPPLRRRHGD